MEGGQALSSIAQQLQSSGSSKQQMQLLLEYARRLPRLPEDQRSYANRVMGCTSQVSRACMAAWLLWEKLTHSPPRPALQQTIPFSWPKQLPAVSTAWRCENRPAACPPRAEHGPCHHHSAPKQAVAKQQAG